MDYIDRKLFGWKSRELKVVRSSLENLEQSDTTLFSMDLSFKPKNDIEKIFGITVDFSLSYLDSLFQLNTFPIQFMNNDVKKQWKFILEL